MYIGAVTDGRENEVEDDEDDGMIGRMEGDDEETIGRIEDDVIGGGI